MLYAMDSSSRGPTGPLGWNDEEEYSVTVLNWKEKSAWLE